MRDPQVEASLLKWNGFSRGMISSQKPYERKKLSEVLETRQIPEKYYLSPRAAAGILRRAEKRGKELPQLLKAALKECEKLQGFPPGWTAIQFRGKEAADGPRYKAIGNSMAVPCIRWICTRILNAHQQAEKEECA